jgi:hypothetical protein
MIPTNPMRPERSIVKLLAMLEGPDLVGIRGDLAASMRVALWGPPEGPAAKRIGAHTVAQNVPAYADVPGGGMSGVWAFWKGPEVDPEVKTEAMLSSVAGLPPHKSIRHDSHISNLAITLILYASEVDAETADELLSDAGYMTQLRQARSTKNNPLSHLVQVSERQIAVAGGPEAARLALEQHIQVVDAGVTVVPKVNQSKLIRFTTTLSHPGIVEQLRRKGKLFVHDGEKELFTFQNSAQPPISKCGQQIVSGEAAGYTKADIDVDSARRALTTLCQSPEYARAGATFNVWSLPDGTVCFRILPRAVGLSVARRATITVGRAKMDVFMSYIANTVASSDVTYKKMLEDLLVSTLPYCQLNVLSPGRPKCTSMAVPSLKIGLLGPFFSNKQTFWPFHNSDQIANAFMRPNFDAKIFPAKLISQNLTYSLDNYCNGLPLSALCCNSAELPFNTSANFNAFNKMTANFSSMSAEGQSRSSIVQFSTTQVVHQRQSVSASHLSLSKLSWRHAKNVVLLIHRTITAMFSFFGLFLSSLALLLFGCFAKLESMPS